MSITKNDVENWVLQQFAEVEKYSHEVGTVLWESSYSIVCDPFVHSEDCLTVQPYLNSTQRIVDFCNSPQSSKGIFLGDYHSHIADTQSWASQFPSSNDLLAPSVFS